MTAAPRWVHLHGQLVEEARARISPFDRGFLLGDGVFETMRAYGGRVLDLDAHLARLERGCRVARLPMPAGLADAIGETLEANGLDDAAVRVTVTRGPGGRGSSPRGAGPATVLVTAAPLPYTEETYARGLTLATSTRRRLPPESLDPEVKSTNYLVHVLARAEAEDAGADEALFLDAREHLVEATQANIFIVRDGEIATPHVESGCLPGIARRFVLALAREAGFRAVERPVPRAELDEADEAFLTASVLEVCAVFAIDGRPLATAPGPVTRTLHALYRKRALSQG